MYRARLIPCLLLRGQGLVKTRKFKDAVYVGDPVNAARIFSEKEVDELIVLDIDASHYGKEPNYELIAEIAGECFMPMAYGGGIRTLEQVHRLIRYGVEKVIINSSAIDSTKIITEVAQVFGSQAVVVAVDVRRTLLGGYRVMSKSASIETHHNLHDYIQKLVSAGAGELFLNSVDRDGMMDGYDIPLIKDIASKVNIPIVACGGAGKIEHFSQALEAGASAVAAGSMFIFYGKHRAVLINYPDELFRQRLTSN